MKQNKKGFTLIELLAVIVILAIIALIAVPVIMNIINSARKSAFEDTAYGIIKAGEMYYASALLNDGITGTKVFTFTEGGSIPEGLNVKGEMPKSGVLEVSKDGKTALAITNGTICIIKGYNDTKPQILESFETCELPAKTLRELARKNDFATSIDACATTGTCTPGTKFAIEVAPGNVKNFYVVSDVNNEVTLIMDSNIGENVAWINQSDYNDDDDWNFCFDEGTEDEWCTGGKNNKGPITALNYLESQTSGWTNIEAKNYALTDDQGQYSNVQRTGARARMLTLTEALAVGCTGYYNGYNGSSATCPTWLYGNLDMQPNGFWLSSARADWADSAWIVGKDGSVDGSGVSYGYYFGVRAVITISKSAI